MNICSVLLPGGDITLTRLIRAPIIASGNLMEASMSEYNDDCHVQNAWAINEYLRYVANYYSKATLNCYKLCPKLLFACCRKSYKDITSGDNQLGGRI